MASARPLLEWKEEYSVEVKAIDDQHKEMFRMINELVGLINVVPDRDRIEPLLDGLIAYRQKHFATEEGYFKQFDFEGAEEHIEEHTRFNDRLEALRSGYADDPIGLAFELVDFLEDWLIDHILNTDRKYIECFRAHGLR